MSGAEITERIRQLRAQMERIRDQVDLEPAGETQQQAAGKQSRLARRLKEIADKAGPAATWAVCSVPWRSTPRPSNGT